MSLYKLLNRNAKAWWHYKELRKQGQHAEARRKERESIRSDIAHMKQATYIRIGRGGCSVHARNSTLQSYESDYWLALGLAFNVPVIDSRSIPDSTIVKVVNFPMVAVGRDPDRQPWHSLSYAPLDHVARLYADVGARVYNLPGV